MLLDEREIALLARFFAKRFPEATDRRPLLERAGLADSVADGPAAWEEIVTRAQEQKALGRLGKALRSDDGDDANLREVRALLAYEPVPRWSLPAAALGMAAALAVVVVGGAAWAIGGRAVEARPEARSNRPVVSVEAAAGPSRVEVVAAAPEGVDAEPVAEPIPAPVAPVATTPVVVSVAPKASVAAAPPPVDGVKPDACARQGGTVSGWWYAGDAPPGQTGDVIVVPRDTYVRAEMPGTSNGWSKNTPVKCVLYAGDKVRLNAAPVRVPVDAWWVSTSSDDVVAAGGKRLRERG